MKILFVSPFPDDNNLYPHARCVFEALSTKYSVQYLYCVERGYELHNIFQGLKNPFKKKFYGSCVRILKLLLFLVLLILKIKKFDIIICIDNFIYCMCHFLFVNSRVILWSHDFISYDQERKNFLCQKTLTIITAKALSRRKEIIIQDEARLELLMHSLLLKSDRDQISPLFLPVSLCATSIDECTFTKKPLLMQLGGIGRHAKSTELFECYEKNVEHFELFFHGFICEEIRNKMNQALFVPIVSSIPVSGNQLPHIVAKADIGFIYYNGENDLNYYNIRNASGQLVEFLRLGKPIIAMGNTNLKEFLEEYIVGIHIKDMDEMQNAIDKIMADYEAFSAESKKTFDTLYSFEIYKNILYLWIENKKIV